MKIQSVFCACLTVFGVAAIAPGADARSVGGRSGNPAIGSAGIYFNESAGAVKNVGGTGCCNSTNDIWEIPLPVDQPGTYNPSIETSGSFCATITVNQNGAILGNTGWQPAPQLVVPFQPGAESVPAGGFLYIACQLPIGSSLYSVNW